MAETITEMILPGTYIEVRAEGLLTIGAISTGNIGIIGTAEMGGAAWRTWTVTRKGAPGSASRASGTRTPSTTI